MNKLIAATALIVFVALVVSFSWVSRPAPPSDVIVLRNQLAAAWSARAYSDEQYRLKQQELYALQRAFAGCVCQDAGASR